MKKKQNKNLKKNVVKKSKVKTVVKLVQEFSNKTGITPLGSRVLIKPYTKEELETKNNFGIILPDSGKKEKSEQGMVVAVGKGEYVEGKLVPVQVKVGDKVAFSKYGYDEISVGGEDYYLIKEDSILAIIK
jgi:chaperonin GroES